MTPLVGSKVWFGPRRGFNWGWAPVSWEGWTVLALGLLLPVLSYFALRTPDGEPSPASAAAAGLPITAMLAACVLKGTSPGGFGDGRYAEFRKIRDADKQR